MKPGKKQAALFRLLASVLHSTPTCSSRPSYRESGSEIWQQTPSANPAKPQSLAKGGRFWKSPPQQGSAPLTPRNPQSRCHHQTRSRFPQPTALAGAALEPGLPTGAAWHRAAGLDPNGGRGRGRRRESLGRGGERSGSPTPAPPGSPLKGAQASRILLSQQLGGWPGAPWATWGCFSCPRALLTCCRLPWMRRRPRRHLPRPPTLPHPQARISCIKARAVPGKKKRKKIIINPSHQPSSCQNSGGTEQNYLCTSQFNSGTAQFLRAWLCNAATAPPARGVCAVLETPTCARGCREPTFILKETHFPTNQAKAHFPIQKRQK